MGTFPEKYGRVWAEYPDFGFGIKKRGTDVPILPTSGE
jgi:hypothetical protein